MRLQQQSADCRHRIHSNEEQQQQQAALRVQQLASARSSTVANSALPARSAEDDDDDDYDYYNHNNAPQTHNQHLFQRPFRSTSTAKHYDETRSDHYNKRAGSPGRLILEAEPETTTSQSRVGSSHLQEQLARSANMPNANNNNNNSHYYYAPPNQTNLLGSHASSQQNTNETTCDDGSPTSNTDESARYLYNQLGTLPTNNLAPSISSTGDYHHYQVVAPANGQQRPNLCLRQSTDLQATCESPCKSIQRLVSNLFQVNQSQPTNKQSQRNRKLTHCAPSSNAIPTINEALVGVEPLIRSSSWQNKTLIDLRQQQQQQHQSAVHYLESSLIQNKTMPHNGRLQQNDAEHLYCGLNTLRASEQPQRPRPSSPLAHYKTDQLNQSFHTFVDKMNERHFYQLNSSSPNFELPHLRAQLGAATLAHQSAYLRRTSSSSAIDSDLDRAGEKQRHKDKSGRHWLAYLFRASQPLCLLIGLLIMTLAALCLAVLLSNYRQHQPISASGPSSDDKGKQRLSNHTNTRKPHKRAKCARHSAQPEAAPHTLRVRSERVKCERNSFARGNEGQSNYLIIV